MVFKPELRRFVLIPLLINGILFSYGLWQGWVWVKPLWTWFDYMTTGWWAWLSWLRWALLPVVILSYLTMVGTVTTLVAGWVGALFNAQLSNAVEEQLTGRFTPPSSLATILAEILPALKDELGMVVYALTRMILLLILCMVIPGAQLVAPGLWFGLGAWLVAINYAACPMGNHGLKGQEIRRRLRSRWRLSMGFGAAVSAVALVPVVNFLVMPAAVIGATLLWVEHWQEIKSP